MATPESWRERAGCRGQDPELFFPTGTGPAAQAQIRRAKAVCARCPVSAECLDEAYRLGDDHAVMGGMTPEERRAARARHIQHGTRRATATRASAEPVISADPPADRVVVDRLIDSGRVDGATRTELAQAAERLVRVGHTTNSAANHLHLRATEVRAWLNTGRDRDSRAGRSATAVRRAGDAVAALRRDWPASGRAAREASDGLSVAADAEVTL